MNKFACYHKPTMCWVFFREDKQGIPMICLCLKPSATTFENKKEAEELLKKSSLMTQMIMVQKIFLNFK